MLILPGVDAEAAEDCAERARAALAELTVRGRPLAASAGVAACPDGRRRRRRAARERRRRAVLRPSAPAAGRRVRYVRGCRCGRRPSSAARSRRCSSRARARSSTVFQPVVELATGRAGGYEALARFDAEPRAGRTSGSRRRTASGSAPSSRRSRCAPRSPSPAGPSGTFLALNVSPRALLSPPVQAALPEDLTEIVIELTEHELFGAEGELDAALAELRARGARVALDDAGAGYAGLQQLIRVAPDILKLDRSLVARRARRPGPARRCWRR